MKKVVHIFVFVILCGHVFGQFRVTGKVTEPNGGMAGVNIYEKGTTIGTASSGDGSYSLSCTGPNAILVFEFIGYQRQEVQVAGRSTVDVMMEEDVTTLMNIEVGGTRNLNRSATETPVAIDIIDIKPLIENAGQLDIQTLLQIVAPSYNTNGQSGSDGADHVDPASIRGLGPDQTLVLINGKRRHQSSNVNIYGTRGRGNTGTDLNAIPVAAIERIEILRDGASAQYGSDAIAGVVNIVLKSSKDQLNGIVSVGARNAKPPSEYSVLRNDNFDGETLQASLNYGTGIGSGGFINVTSEFLGRQFTNRPTDPNKFDVYRNHFGDAAVDNYRMFFNSSLPVGQDAEVYAFGGYNFREGQSYAFTRFPEEPSNVLDIYPDGFEPLITSRITDKSLSMGLRSKLNEWNIDFNNTYGINRFHYIIDKTINASLVAKSPTRFDAGGYQLSQNTTGLNFTRYFKDALQGVNVAFGTEYRIENYQIFAGEEGSYKNYEQYFFNDNDQQVFSGIMFEGTGDEEGVSIFKNLDNTYEDANGNVLIPVGNDFANGNGELITAVSPVNRPGGSQGFPGFSPANEVNEYRQNISMYFDSEFNFSKRFMVGTAVRYEKYSDFGSTINGKIATRAELSDKLAFRASISSGFRAPSLVQVYYNNTYSDIIAGDVIINMIARNNSPLTKTLGIPALKQEKSINFSAGLVYQGGPFSATIDAYKIEIRDRIVLTGAFKSDDPDIGDELQSLGISQARFFTNAVSTSTKGADVVLSYQLPVGRNSLKFTYAGNFNDMTFNRVETAPKLAGKEDTYFDLSEQYFLLASAPKTKMNFSALYSAGKFRLYTRAVRYGEVLLRTYFGDADEKFDAKVTLDCTLGYEITPKVNFSIGGTNILNVYPNQYDASNTGTGGVWEAVQMGFSGAFYFSKLLFRF